MNKIITLGIDTLDEDKFNHHLTSAKKQHMSALNKPAGSLWGSTFTPDEDYCSDWHRWSDQEEYATYTTGCIYQLKSTARVYTIDTVDDLVGLLKRYPYISYLGNWVHPLTVYIDYNKVCQDIDAIHLTHNGNNQTHLLWGHDVIPIQVGGNNISCKISDLNSWDVESWLILNFDCIDLKSVQQYHVERR